MAVVAIMTVLATVGAVDTPAEAAPNPIPVLSLTLEPTQLKAHVTDIDLGTVTFNGTVTVDQLSFLSSTVTLQCVVNTGWPVVISPTTISFEGSGTERYYVTVIVPPMTSPLLTGNVIVTGNCKVPGLAPVVASASAVVTVHLDIVEGTFELYVYAPLRNETVTEDHYLIHGNTTYSRGDVIRVEIRVDDSQWLRALGTNDWSYTFNMSYLAPGYHILYIRSFSEYFESNTTRVPFKVERAPPDTVTPGTGGEDGGSSAYLAASFVAVLVVAIVLVVLAVRWRNRDYGP